MRITASHVLSRGAGFILFWIIVAGVDPSDLPAAAVAVGSATWASLVLLPPRRGRVSVSGLLRLAVRFPVQSMIAGVDVARRAFDPRLPLRPGFVSCATRLPAGMERNLLGTMLSLVPGTLPAGTDERGGLYIHCLDVRQPIPARVAFEEALLARALGRELGDG